jgi:DNA ligase (NAD+)
VDELQRAEEVGPKVAESVYQFFHEPRNRNWWSACARPACKFTYASKRKKGGPLQGPDVRAHRHAAHLSREEAKA